MAVEVSASAGLRRRVTRAFDHFASRASTITGKPLAFVLAVFVLLMWGVTGPLFGFSDTWQLLINTATTIVTFLMVFLLQHAQWRDTLSVQLKLDELIAAVEGASNRLIDLEDESEEELEDLRKRFQRLASEAKRLHPGEHLTLDEEFPDEPRDRRGPMPGA